MSRRTCPAPHASLGWRSTRLDGVRVGSRSSSGSASPQSSSTAGARIALCCSIWRCSGDSGMCTYSSRGLARRAPPVTYCIRWLAERGHLVGLGSRLALGFTLTLTLTLNSCIRWLAERGHLATMATSTSTGSSSSGPTRAVARLGCGQRAGGEGGRAHGVRARARARACACACARDRRGHDCGGRAARACGSTELEGTCRAVAPMGCQPESVRWISPLVGCQPRSVTRAVGTQSGPPKPSAHSAHCGPANCAGQRHSPGYG